MKKADVQDIKRIADALYGPYANNILKIKQKSDYEGFDEPIADSVGLKQHDSECASDCIQEVLLFADGIREYTQPIMYELTEDQIELRVRLNSDSDDWTKFQEYLHYVQKRFRSHYDVINYLRKHKVKQQKYYDDYAQVCTMNPLFRRKERASIEAAVLAVKRYKEETEYTSTGLYFKQVNQIIDTILNCFGVPYVQKSGIDKKGIAIICQATKSMVMYDGKDKNRSIGHVVSFFKTLDKWVYYDNNIGFLYVDESVIDTLRLGRLVVVIYKKVYFVKTSSNGKYESAWSEGKWETALVKDLYNKDGSYHKGTYSYHSFQNISITKAPEISLDDIYTLCEISESDLKPKAAEDVRATMEKFRTGIYANLDSNSRIFEAMYKFLFTAFNVVKDDQESVEFINQTLPNIVLRPACSPLTLYWCHKLKLAISNKASSIQMFELPKLKSIYVPKDERNTPPSLLKRLAEVRKRVFNKMSPKYTPCLPGQVRDAKTKKCRDRVKKQDPNEPKKEKTKKNKPKANSKKVERCPKGEVRNPKTGLCEPKLEPCPPGQIRDKETKICVGRLDNKKCPEGQVRNAVTKKCRDKIAYKF